MELENVYWRIWSAIPSREKKKIKLGAFLAGGLFLGITKTPWRKILAVLAPNTLFLIDTFCPQINLFAKPFWRGKSQRSLALSFDDGPDPFITPHLVELLERYQARATFFQLVEQARRYPQILKFIKASGHEIGLHGLNHRKVHLMGQRQFRKNIEKGRKQLEDLLGEMVLWYRPPHGFLRFDQYLILKKLGLKVAGWTIGVWDTDENVTAKEIFERLRKSVRPGDIVLLHDSVAERHRPQTAMLKALDVFLASLSTQGIKAVTISELWEETKSGQKIQ
ncbi:polysaccharide deacetylase family protein [Thermodesulfatator atlanticus]|uniref:polysaccharide deacetylase family protein n=1 Tax=Thermodesulfatator atlanticus TaxID=501497 RepID=UPI0003B57728|nr:polysaccharide deacetylase family protein [Thermodesulfatator atlanticus]